MGQIVRFEHKYSWDWRFWRKRLVKILQFLNKTFDFKQKINFQKFNRYFIWSYYMFVIIFCVLHFMLVYLCEFSIIMHGHTDTWNPKREIIILILFSLGRFAPKSPTLTKIVPQLKIILMYVPWIAHFLTYFLINCS